MNPSTKIEKYEIRFFIVGKASKGGDAIFIRLYDEQDKPTVIVIDGGYAENGNEIIRYMIDECKLKTIDLVVNTHPDIDHISGLIQLFQSDEITIKKLLMNRPWRDANLKSSLFKDGRITNNSLKQKLTDNFKKAFELEQIAIQKIGEENIIHPVIKNTYFDCLTILSPTTDFYRSCLLNSEKTPETSNALFEFANALLHQPRSTIYKTISFFKGNIIKWFDDETTSPINETSIILLLQLPNRNFLFTGDAGKEALKKALELYHNMFPYTTINSMQLPHHGSRKNIDPTLIKEINASQYYISCPPNGFDSGHYSRRLTNMILSKQSNAEIYTTQEGWISSHEGLVIGGIPATPLTISDEMDDQPA